MNATSTLVTWRPPLAKHQNGVIKEYHVELTQVNSTTLFQYTTQEPYLLIDSLEPGIIYICTVAAFTVGRGPSSEAITIASADIDSGTNSGTVETGC